MNLSQKQKAVLALILVNIIWGAALPIYKWSLEDVRPFTFAFLRFFLASLIILPFAYKKLFVQKNDRKILLLSSLSGITLTIPLLFFGLQNTTSITAPIILSSGPIALIIGSIIFLKERVNPKVLFGTGVSFLGVLIVVIQPLLSSMSSGSVFGNLLITIAVLFDIGHTLILKKILKSYSPLTITFWMFFVGSVGLFPFFLYELATYEFVVTVQGLIGVFYSILLSSVFAYLLAVYALKRLLANEIGIFTYIDPFVTALVAIPLLGEIITLPYLVGGLFVFLGIFIAENKFHFHPFHKFKA
jgi:drug/metabolite transporter (DMT)-like permease